ncbi:MAG: hypothetical protein CMJ85_08545 [Planctomycetes bacterium]|nr:hypothetical protein [Planctomycetota bacterium]
MLVTTAILLCLALQPGPRAVFPQPTGPHAVGTTTFHWIDADRNETFTETKDDKRELMVQVWYPAQKTKKPAFSPYLPDFDLLEQALPPAFGAHGKRLAMVRVAADVDAPPRAGPRLPVVVLSQGLGQSRLFYTSQALELASYGYAVVTIDHTYDVNGIVFPERRVVERRSEAGAESEKVTFSKTGRKATPRLEVWSADQRFVLDQLGRLHAGKLSPLLKGRLDLKRVGLLGHCYGADAAMLTASRDARVKACVNQNGWPLCAEVINGGLKMPLLFLWGELTPSVVHARTLGLPDDKLAALMSAFRTSQRKVLEKLGTSVCHVEVLDHEHIAFSDLPMLLAWLETPVDSPMQLPPRMRLVRSWTRAFFDRYLKGKRGALSTQAEDANGVRVERYGGVRKQH